MNRTDLHALAHTRLEEAEYLLKGRYFSGAYYLAGYAVECALKACIAKTTQEHDFPDRKRVIESYSHDLAQLLRVAGLEQELRVARLQTPGLGRKWETIQQWNEGSRYGLIAEEFARSMLDAVGNRDEGVLRWLTRYW